MAKFDLLNKVVGFLKQNPERRYTAQEIAKWILKNHPKDCLKKKEESDVIHNDEALLAQIAREISPRRWNLQKKDLKIKIIEGVRPQKFYYTGLSDSEEISHAEDSTSASPVTNAESIKEKRKKEEAKLYPILTKFLSSLQIYSKRIDERRSRNTRRSGGNKWLFPDLVGMDNLSKDWHSEIKDCVKGYGDKKSKLWSFEVKIRINPSTVRESFFQAVSNSSWANFGYLVAKEIVGPGTSEELQMLSNLHGIGFILLDDENPSESQIIIQAKERNEIDWNIANRLTEENSDFRKYIEAIHQFYSIDRIYPKDWDTDFQED